MKKPRLPVSIRFILSALLELAGIVAITWGFTLMAPFLGFIIGGFLLVVLGLAVDPPVGKPAKGPEQ